MASNLPRWLRLPALQSRTSPADSVRLTGLMTPVSTWSRLLESQPPWRCARLPFVRAFSLAFPTARPKLLSGWRYAAAGPVEIGARLVGFGRRRDLASVLEGEFILAFFLPSSRACHLNPFPMVFGRSGTTALVRQSGRPQSDIETPAAPCSASGSRRPDLLDLSL